MDTGPSGEDEENLTLLRLSSKHRGEIGVMGATHLLRSDGQRWVRM